MAIHKLQIALVSDANCVDLVAQLQAALHGPAVHELPWDAVLRRDDSFLRSIRALELKFVFILLGRPAELPSAAHLEALRALAAELVFCSVVVPPHRRGLPHPAAERARAWNDWGEQHFRSDQWIDLELIAQDVGKALWIDDRAWAVARAPCALDFHPRITQEILSFLRRAQGEFVKALALDLDGTLWSGVLDEDDPATFAWAPDSLVLHETLRALRDTGVRLALVTKNDRRDVEAGLAKFPPGHLQLTEFDAVYASWDEKACAIAEFARSFQTDPRQILFIDDSRWEIERAQQALPHLLTLHHVGGPAELTLTLGTTGLLSRGPTTAEDQRRKAATPVSTNALLMPRADHPCAQFTQLALSAASLERTCQLFARTNQFNMRTARYTRTQLESRNPQDARLFSLDDGTQDLGIVSAVLLKEEGPALVIEDWVLSCRAFARGLEAAILNVLASEALRRGKTELRGLVTPSERNQLARALYPSQGFTEANPGEWVCPLPQQFTTSLKERTP